MVCRRCACHALPGERQDSCHPVSDPGGICEIEMKWDWLESKVSPQTRFRQLWCFFAMTQFDYFWSFAVANYELTLLWTATNAP
jgi:hypothetical protein